MCQNVTLDMWNLNNRILWYSETWYSFNKQCQGFESQSERLFPTQFTCQWSVNMIKLLWSLFQQCLGTFTMLLVEQLSETGLFRNLSNHVFGVRKSGNTKALRVIFFSKYSKFNIDFKIAQKNWEKVSCFWGNCICIGMVKLLLLRTAYFSSSTNG